MKKILLLLALCSVGSFAANLIVPDVACAQFRRTLKDWTDLEDDWQAKDGTVFQVEFNGVTHGWKWCANDTTTANSIAGVAPGTVVASTQRGISGRWLLQFDGIVNGELFGASSLSTGAVNSTAIQAAIDAVPDGTTVTLGEGTFDLSSQLVMNRSVSLVGSGMRTTIIQSSVNGPAIRVNDGLQASPNEVTGNTVGDLTLDGNDTGTFGLWLGNSGAVGVKSANSGSYTDLWITGFTDAAIYGDACQLNNFQNVTCTNNDGDGFRAGSNPTTSMNTACTFVNCHFRRNGRGVVLLDGAYAYRFFGSVIEQNKGLGVTIERDAFGNFLQSFIDCYFESNCTEFAVSEESNHTNHGAISGSSLPAGSSGDYLTPTSTEAIGGRTFTNGVKYYLSGESAGGTDSVAANQWIASDERCHAMLCGEGIGPTSINFSRSYLSKNLDIGILVRRGRVKLDDATLAGSGSSVLFKTESTSTAVVHAITHHGSATYSLGNDSVVMLDEFGIDSSFKRYVKQNSSNGMRLMRMDGRERFFVNATTIDVSNMSRAEINNSSAQTLTDLTNGERGQRVTLLCRDGLVTIVNGGNFQLTADWAPTTSGGILVLERTIDNGGSDIWREVSRSNY